MQQIICDQCQRVIDQRSAGWTTVVTRKFDQAVDHDLCGPSCVRLFIDDEWPAKRPDFPAAHAKLSSLPVPPTNGQRITAAELAADEADKARAADALDDLVDTGALDADGAADDALEPFDPIALIGRKTRPAGLLSSLPGPDVARMIRDNRETGS